MEDAGKRIDGGRSGEKEVNRGGAEARRRELSAEGWGKGGKHGGHRGHGEDIFG